METIRLLATIIFEVAPRNKDIEAGKELTQKEPVAYIEEKRVPNQILFDHGHGLKDGIRARSKDGFIEVDVISDNRLPGFNSFDWDDYSNQVKPRLKFQDNQGLELSTLYLKA